MTPYRILPVLALATCFAQPAWAQINPFVGSASQPMTQDDLDALGAATTRLLDRDNLVPGGIETWQDPKTGASGTVTAGSPVKRKGYDCRIVVYQNSPTAAGPRALPTARLTWCKTPDGWKIG
jgi:hypothetical protein